jgi:hypothetical protein
MYGFFLARSQNSEKQLLASSCLSVRPPVRLSARNNSAPTERIFVKFDLNIFRKSVDRIHALSKSYKNSRYFTGKPTCIHSSILFVSSCNEKCFRKKVVEKIQTHISRSVTFFFSKNRAVCEIAGKNMVETHRPHKTI